MNRYNECTLDRERSSLDEEIWSTIEKLLPSYEFSGEESFAWDKLEASEKALEEVTFNDSFPTSAKNPSISNQSSNKTFSKGEKFVHPCVWSCRDLQSPLSSLDDEAFITGSLENPKIPDVGTHQLEERINKNEEQIQFLTTSMKQVVSVLDSMVSEIDRLKKNSTQKPKIWISKLKTELNAPPKTQHHQIIYDK